MLKVTIEILPYGNKSELRLLDVITISNNLTGDAVTGNYRVTAEGQTIGGRDTYADFELKDFERGSGYLELVRAALEQIKEIVGV